ncbi:MAG: hypothetical protein ACRCV0_06095 [Brevinema sp.]
MVKYPIKFLLPNKDYKNVSVHSDNFPQDIETSMIYNERNNCFSTTIELPEGTYTYRFKADDVFIDDVLRAPSGGIATLMLCNDDGLFFESDKVFIKNNSIILTLGIDSSIWDSAILNIQTLHGIQTISGYHGFFEGAFEYQHFTVPIPDEGVLLGYFELTKEDDHFYLGENGIKEQEWSISPLEISTENISSISQHNDVDIVASYYLTQPKVIQEFEKHYDYFEKFPIDHLVGKIETTSILLQNHKLYQDYPQNQALACLLRDIFTEKEEISPGMGLLGRYTYECRQDISTIPFTLSDDEVSFWHVCRRDIPTAMRGIIFQLFCTLNPKIIFGEEIGLVKTGSERNMYWTKTKWNKELYNFYVKLLKLRKKYPVLRKGGFRFVLQDCAVWGVERFMLGEDSIFIFANHSKQNVVIDLTKIMNHSGAIIEMLTDHPLKRKRVCTLFADSVSVFKINGIHVPLKETDEELIEEY